MNERILTLAIVPLPHYTDPWIIFMSDIFGRIDQPQRNRSQKVDKFQSSGFRIKEGISRSRYVWVDLYRYTV